MAGRRLRAPALLLVVVLSASACEDGDDAEDRTVATTGATTQTTPAVTRNLSADDLPQAVAQTSDLPPGYQLKDAESGPRRGTACTATREGKATALTPRFESLGLQSCFFGTFTKEVTNSAGEANNDPASSALLFADAGRASEALPLLREAIRLSFRPSGDAETVAPESIPVSGLGDESAPGLRFPVQGGTLAYNLFFYVWRVRNVVMFFGSGDFLGDLDEQSILGIAEKIDARIAR